MTRRPTPGLAAICGVLAILLSGCAAAAADQGATCDGAFAQAMAIDPATDTVGAIDDTIASCSSLEAWVAAASRHRPWIAGQDPIAYAATRCAAAPRIAHSAVCLAVPVPAAR